MYSPPFLRYRADLIGVWYRWNAHDDARAIVGSVWAKNVGRKGGGLFCGTRSMRGLHLVTFAIWGRLPSIVVLLEWL